jgi:hypothetical protein
MMMYEIDFTKLITQYLPSYKRKSLRIGWLVALTSYLRSIHVEFLNHFNGIKTEMKWDGRTILLERYLQLKFATPTLAIINKDISTNPLIGFPEPNPINQIGTEADDPNAVIGYSADSLLDLTSFKIQMPIATGAIDTELTAVVNRYLIGAANFEIERI